MEEPRPYTEEQRKAAERLLYFFRHEMDWDKFWANVARKAAPEIEAYRRARANYLRHPRAFLAAA